MAAAAQLDPLVVAYDLVSGLSAVPWWCWLAVVLMVVAKFVPEQESPEASTSASSSGPVGRHNVTVSTSSITS